jgi:osmoprotectant transport system substrate-binding protein
MRVAVRLLLGFLALVVLGGCMPSNLAGDLRRAPKPTVRVGAMNFSEQTVLSELYGQMLEANGYRVEQQQNLGTRETVEPALESGRIDLYLEYLATMLAFVTRGADRGSTDPAATRQSLQGRLTEAGITVLEYAPAVNTNGFVVTQATATKHQLARMSDLAPVAPQLVLGGPPECPVRPFCLPGLRDAYGIAFRDFKILDTGGPLTVAGVESGQVDVGLLFTTDPFINAKQLVLLEDDKHLQLADNVTPVVRSTLLSKAPPDLQSSLNSVSAKLTTAELTRLNAQAQIESTNPKAVASDWLRGQGLVK